MADEPRRAYRSYLLRLWQVTSGGRITWRASLESAHSRELAGFGSLEALFEHLRAEAERAARPPPVEQEGGENPGSVPTA